MDVFHVGIWTGLKLPGLPQVWKRSEAELETHGTVRAICRQSPDGKGKAWGLLPPRVVHCHGKTQLPQEGVGISSKRCEINRVQHQGQSVGSSRSTNETSILCLILNSHR